MTPVAVLSENAEDSARALCVAGLSAFNDAAAGGPLDAPPLHVLIRDGRVGPPLGGLIGGVYANWLFVQLLFVPEPLRGKGWGRALMTIAEQAARDRRLTGIRLDTFSFQARGFYERLGFSVFGELPDCPPGHTRYFLSKRLPETPA